MHGVSELRLYGTVNGIVKILVPQSASCTGCVSKNASYIYSLTVHTLSPGCSRVDMAHTPQTTLFSFSVTRALRILR